MVNPDIQQKLYEEIVKTREQLGGKRVSYDVLQKMKYMDQVICETLRKWPPAIQLGRLCVRDYLYDDGNKLKFLFEKGREFSISIYGIQHDPKYFPDPEKFDPERFSDENKNNIVPGTYIPFGIGPRNCIGKNRKIWICSSKKEIWTVDFWYVFYRISIRAHGNQSNFVLSLVKFLFWTKRKDRNSSTIQERRFLNNNKKWNASGVEATKPMNKPKFSLNLSLFGRNEGGSLLNELTIDNS